MGTREDGSVGAGSKPALFCTATRSCAYGVLMLVIVYLCIEPTEFIEIGSPVLGISYAAHRPDFLNQFEIQISD